MSWRTLFFVMTLSCVVATRAYADEGRQWYEKTCNYCHGPGGFAAKKLAKRLGESRALLASRTDLNADYIRYVVRHGIGSMPWYSRTDLSDAQLELVVAWLVREQ